MVYKLKIIDYYTTICILDLMISIKRENKGIFFITLFNNICNKTSFHNFYTCNLRNLFLY